MIDLDSMSDDDKLAALESIHKSIAESKELQKQKIAANVDLVLQALKKMESDIRARYDETGKTIEKRVASIKDGRDGRNGLDGKNGKDGRNGKDGAIGPRGNDGLNGINGVDGQDGVSVTDAKIDFDGSLIITLSTGQEINVGEVVSPDLADKIQVISTMSTNGAVGIKDEGSSISTGVKNINFVGAAVTASASGDEVTVNVSSGTGTVTSVAATGGTGISVSGSPITTSGTLTITNTAPDQTVALTQGGTTTITGTYPNFTISSADQFVGTVTSVTGTSPVVSSGGTTPAISLASGYGDTLNAYASKTANFVLAAPNGAAGVPTFRAVVAADIPTLNQNTTGTASNVTGTVAIANGGTGETSRQNAMDALAGSVTSGSYLRGNGTDVVMATIQVADVPTLNQSTTGSAATLTTGRTIAVTGDLAYTSGSFNGSGNVTGTGTLATVNSNVGSFTSANITVNAKGLITAAANGTAGVVFPSGTAILFAQTAAPTGFTKSTTHDNKALRVVSGTASSGGTTAFTTVFANQTPTITTTGLSAGATTLTTTQIPAHTHDVFVTSIGLGGGGGSLVGGAATNATSSTGGGDSHTHTVTGTATSSAITLNVQYVDVIIATKN